MYCLENDSTLKTLNFCYSKAWLLFVVLFTMLIYPLFSSPAYSYSYGSLAPRGNYYDNKDIDVQELFKNKSIYGKWDVGGTGIPVEVFGERCRDRRLNFFSTIAAIDGTRTPNPGGNIVVETNFIRITMRAELGKRKILTDLPWFNTEGLDSDAVGYGCTSMKTIGIFAGKKGDYRIEMIKPFTQNDKIFDRITVYFYGARDNDNNRWKDVYTGEGSHYYYSNFNFKNWTSPYKCNLKLNPQTVDFSAISESQLIKGIAAKTLTVETECSGGDFDPNGPILDDLATNIRFQSGDTVDGDSDFRTKNPTTNKVNDNLVFRINDRHTNQPVKNNHRIDIELTKDNPNNPISSFARQFDVYPYWKGGTNRDIPLGHFETSGVVIFELE